MNAAQIQVMLEAHQSWLQHPVTQQLIRNLMKQREEFADRSAAISSDHSIPDAQFRQNAHGMKTIDAILKMVRDTNVFNAQFINK